MAAFYNEFEPYAVEWLLNLIKAGLIADGEVDGRSIVDIGPSDLRGFTQCHFFAGIGVWSHALRLAGWSDDQPVWTGSCPCQPFSAAGNGKGVEDERHLWPEFHRLIAECRPPVVFGEQVASKDGLGWLDAVFTDLEGSGYAAGAVDLCAAGVGAPHIRQRLWFVGERVAHTSEGGRSERSSARLHADGQSRNNIAGCREDGGLGHDNDTRLEGQRSGHQAEGGWIGAVRPVAQAGEPRGMADAQHDDGRADEPGRGSQGRDADGRSGAVGGMADAECVDGRGQHRGCVDRAQEEGEGKLGERKRVWADPTDGCTVGRPRPTNGHWRDADWLHCRDGKWRPVEPGTFPLVNGAPARVGRLRAYGNAIVPQVAAEVIAAFMECRP